MSLFSIGGRNPRAGRIVKVLTPAMFFGADNYPAVFPDGKSFLSYGECLRPSEVSDLEKFFKLAKARVRSDGDLEEREDQGGKRYVYPHFQRGNSNPGTKIVLAEDMLRFLTEYFDDQFVIGFDLEELIVEARNRN